MKILAVNPGSTSTKLAVFENKKCIFKESVEHDPKELGKFKTISDQKDYRTKTITDFLQRNGFKLSDIDVFVGRGGLVRNLESGVYRINQDYLHDATIGYNGQHASNLGGIIVSELAKEVDPNKDAYIVDPVVVDEYAEIAKISGMPEISRVRSFHALNQKAVAHRYAKESKKKYEKLNLIVAHLGGGISVGAHEKGRIIDVNSALGGDGPFSPERAGGVPPLALINMCYSGKYTYDEMYQKLIGKGGLVAYLGTTNVKEIMQRIKAGDQKAKLILEAMAYQVAKEIGVCATVLKGKVDAIIITGGIAHNKIITDWIVERVKFICKKIVIYPGEDEMQALAEGVYLALTGKLPIKEYTAKYLKQ